MKNKYLSILLSYFLLTLVIACSNDNEEDLLGNAECNTENVSFSATIAPIMNNSCAINGCHDANTRRSNYDLSDYNGVIRGIDRGKFLASIRHDSGTAPMPKSRNKLPQCDIDKIASWINAGAPNN